MEIIYHFDLGIHSRLQLAHASSPELADPWLALFLDELVFLFIIDEATLLMDHSIPNFIELGGNLTAVD